MTKEKPYPCVDANDTLVVTISKNDVRLGSKKDADGCAAARAICRQTGAVAAKVHLSRTYVKTEP